MRPMPFLLHAYLPERYKKRHRKHAQVSYGRFGGWCCEEELRYKVIPAVLTI